MSKVIPFNQRFGADLIGRPLDKEVPASARIGFIGILSKLIDQGYIPGWYSLVREVLLVARRLKQEFASTGDEEICVAVIKELAWDKFYVFCEKVYKTLQPEQYWEDQLNDYVAVGTLEESQHHFTDEINEFLAEENLAYEFVEGAFQRRGRPQTQKNLQRVSSVLSDPRYAQARSHYNKAVKFFNERPAADVQNCIKEAVCALEAFTEILFGKKAAEEFDEAIRSKQGNLAGQIPPAIGENILKLRALRGSAPGTAQAVLEGGLAGGIEAELVLSLVASYITYLRDKFPPKEEDVPF
jgi:hypothetical protein